MGRGDKEDIGAVSKGMVEDHLGKKISSAKWQEIIEDCQDDCYDATFEIIGDYLEA